VKRATAIVLAALLASSCHRHPEWSGWVYPDKDTPEHHLNIGHFYSLEDCRAAAQAKLDAQDDPMAGNYLCSYKCRWNKGAEMEICENDGA
jgi:hypothetical protein